MRRFVLFLCCMIPLFSWAGHPDSWKIVVLSDVHIMAPSLLRADGKAFQTYLSGDRKLLREGPELLDSVCARIEKDHPQFIFITGDLTKDGEKLSHLFLVENYLKKLKASGVRIFVIPGNHDINNPHARVYEGDQAPRTSTISAREFADIYKDYGYGEAIARDSSSLSYAAQLTPHLRLIAIDACRYEDNDFGKDICVTAGRIKPSTMTFIRKQAQMALQDSCKVIAMIHHGIIPHFSLEREVLPEYLVNDDQAIARQLENMGIRVVFSGHLHSNDISSDGLLTDVETGSTVSYPHPYRMIRLSADSLSITTGHITTLGSMKGSGESLTEKSRHFAMLAVQKMVGEYFPANIPEKVKVQIGQLLGEAYLIHLSGDESRPADFSEEVNRMVLTLRPLSPQVAGLVDNVALSLTEDTPPKDNHVIIAY